MGLTVNRNLVQVGSYTLAAAGLVQLLRDQSKRAKQEQLEKEKAEKNAILAGLVQKILMERSKQASKVNESNKTIPSNTTIPTNKTYETWEDFLRDGKTDFP